MEGPSISSHTLFSASSNTSGASASFQSNPPAPFVLLGLHPLCQLSLRNLELIHVRGKFIVSQTQVHNYVDHVLHRRWVKTTLW